VSVADKARKTRRTRKTRDIALSGSKRATIGLGQKKRINYRSRATNRTIIAKFRALLRAADFHEISAKRVRPALKHVASQVRAVTNPGVGKVTSAGVGNGTSGEPTGCRGDAARFHRASQLPKLDEPKLQLTARAKRMFRRVRSVYHAMNTPPLVRGFAETL